MTPGPGIARTPLPKSFLCSGVNSGVRRYRPDLGLILSECEMTIAGVYTQNQCKAAPVVRCMKLTPGTNFRAIITNSGQANAATGVEGIKRDIEMVTKVAQELGCQPDQVISASTGVIGVQLDNEKILPSIAELVLRANDTAESFATAIMTTDLVPKTVTTQVNLSKGTVTITGIAKGSGMIHPNMATMLGYMLTDIVLTADQADKYVKEAANISFNMISVDGDSSTNDTCFLLANGASGVSITSRDDEILFQTALNEIAIYLAKSIARDGEGATKLVEVQIDSAPNFEIAKRAARGLTLSPLLKCAIHGEDPNWGRILARLGSEQVPAECFDKLDVQLQGVTVFENGAPKGFDRDGLRALLKKEIVVIHVQLKSGTTQAKAWGCDLSKKYVEINTDYS